MSDISEFLEKIEQNCPEYTEATLRGDELSVSSCKRLGRAISGNTHLEQLWLDGNELDDDGLVPILEAILTSNLLRQERQMNGHRDNLSKLKALYLTNNRLSDKAAEHLEKFLTQAPLDSLNLTSNRLTSRGAHSLSRALSYRHGSHLLNLRLSSNNIGDDGAMAIARALDPFVTGETPRLHTLHLKKTGITSQGAEQLAKNLKSNENVTSVALGNNNIDKDILDKINATCERNRNKVTSPPPNPNPSPPSNRGVSVEGTIQILNQCSSSPPAGDRQTNGNLHGLQEIIFLNDDIPHATLAKLCEAIINYSKSTHRNRLVPIKTIWFNNNGIGDESMLCLSMAVVNCMALEELHITRNKISDNGVSHLSQCLTEPGCCLKRLVLTNNNIADDGARALANVLKENKHLEELRLNGNKIGDNGAMDFSRALFKNSSLKVLGLRKNRINETGGINVIVGMRGRQERGRRVSVLIDGNSISDDLTGQLQRLNSEGVDLS